jgi:putative oxidoreductase
MTDTTSDTALAIPALKPVYASLSDVAHAVLRIAAGGFLIPHGAQKLFGLFGGYGLEATGQFFQTQLGFSHGYLAALGAGSVEFFGGLLLALGLGTRFAAAAIAVMLSVAMTVHIPHGFFWTDGGFEYPVLWSILALSFVAKGGGRYSVDRLIGVEI